RRPDARTPAPMPHPCDDCVAGCCREPHLLPTVVDVHRIARALRLPPSVFATLRARDGDGPGFPIHLTPAPPREALRLELKKVPDEAGGYSRRCIFLLTLDGRGRCGVYGVRPVDCARYPVFVERDVVSLPRRLPLCPPGGWTLAIVDGGAARNLESQKE